MMKRLIAAVALTLLSALAQAAPSTCPEHFFDGDAPTLVNEKLAAQTQPICYAGFAVLHSGITRTPLWSAEHLTRARVEAAETVERYNAFHPDESLPVAERAELSDYARSGFDRGHMAPSGDMPDRTAQYQSFSLANIVPQNPDNNRHLWEGIERAVRELARKAGELYVVTGPVFQGETLQRLHGSVLVPSALFKAVYDPAQGQAGAYVTPNAPGDQWEEVSLDQLRALTGIDVFPALSPAVKAHAMALPAPKLHGHKRRAQARATEPSGAGSIP